MASGLCDHWSFLRPLFGDEAASSSTARTSPAVSIHSNANYPNYKIEAGNKYFTELKALLDGRFADDTAKLKQLLPGKDIDRLWGGGVARPGQRKSWQTMSI